MLLIDVNVLVHAFREDSPDHTAIRAWLMEVLESGRPLGIADLVLSGFLRIATHPKVFKPPSPWTKPSALWRLSASSLATRA